jgi:hypothetical protein
MRQANDLPGRNAAFAWLQHSAERSFSRKAKLTKAGGWTAVVGQVPSGSLAGLTEHYY